MAYDQLYLQKDLLYRSIFYMKSISNLILKVIFRSGRAVFIPISMLSYFVIGYCSLMLGHINESWVFVSIGFGVTSISTGLFFTLHSFRLLSINFDAISVWPIQESELLRAVRNISWMFNTFLYGLAMFITLILFQDHIFAVVAAFLFSSGIIQFVYMELSMYEHNHFDVTQSAFSVDDAVLSRPFKNNLYTFGIICITAFVVFVFDMVGYLTYVWIVFAFFGMVGFLANKYVTSRIESLLSDRKYYFKEGFRKK